jgi:hypothetical protein
MLAKINAGKGLYSNLDVSLSKRRGRKQKGEKWQPNCKNHPNG